MSSLSLSLLGHLIISWGERPLTTFRSNRVPALLVYLAVETEHPHRREALMELLWPGLPAASARQNLRQTLYLLRQEIPELTAKSGEGIVPVMLSDRHTIQLNLDGDLCLDVARMEQLTSGQPTTDELIEAIALYRGDFLADFYLPDSENFEEWVAARRAGCRRQVLAALTKLTAVYLQQGNFSQAEAYARQQIEIDNLRESGHRQLMEALARNGRRRAALSHYESVSLLLQKELGIEPSLETQTLVKLIRAGTVAKTKEADSSPSETTAVMATLTDISVEITDEQLTTHQTIPIDAPNNLPVQSTPFVGREAELSLLGELIGDPNRRLITILGAGGMGKTRLALAAAERQLARMTLERAKASAHYQPQFSDGIYFISLAGLSSANDMATKIAQALAFQFQPGGSLTPKQQLLKHLEQKHLLLIMDNFEHLLDGVDLVADILQMVPTVQVLATSRERLHLHEEQLFTIEGLTFPEQETHTVPPTPNDVTDYEAIELFMQCARRVQHDFELTTNELSTLIHICRLVEGMPLALELAASWVDVLPLADITTEIQSRIDFLETEIHNIPARHRSIRAAMDTSWERLSGEEQKLLAGLSVFQGGFTRLAGQRVAGGSLRMLARLVDKSWLQYDKKEDRYQIHRLLGQYGTEKLAADAERETAVLTAHSTFYCHDLQAQEAAMKSNRQSIALAEIVADDDNIRAAWHWAVERREWELLDMATNGLGRFYMLSLRWTEGERVFQQTASNLETSTSQPLILAKILTWWANLIWSVDYPGPFKSTLQQSLALLESPGLTNNQDAWLTKAHALFLMGINTGFQKNDPNLATAKHLLEQSFSLYQDAGDRWGAAWVQGWLGLYQFASGLKAEGRQTLTESLAAFRVLGDPIESLNTLHFLSYITILDGKLKDAERLYQEGVSLSTTGKIRLGFAGMMMLNGLGFLALYRGAFTQAESYFQSALATQKSNSDRVPDEFVYRLGQTLLKMHHGQYEKANISNPRQLALGPVHFSYYVRQISLIQGSVALALGNYAEAQAFIQEAITLYKTIQEQHFLVEALGVMGTIQLKMGKQEEGRQYLQQGLQLAIDTRSFKNASVLAGSALLLAEIGQKKQAVELYALVKCQPLVANSRWFADVYGQPLAAATESLPSTLVRTAQTQGKMSDLWQTATTLLEELHRLSESQSPIVSAVAHNLLSQPTPFIGRAMELADLDEFIADPNVRLVTIVGQGGIGKTRLALACGERHITADTRFPNGVFFVNLAPLSQVDQIASALADALNFQLRGGDTRSSQQQLLDYLRRKKILLLFDNFEHLLDGVDLIADILQVALKVQILVTSRERLHLRAEQVYPIEGLSIPDAKGKAVTEFTAVQLFLQFAHRNKPGFALRDDADLTHLTHICHMVAGMPLALELTASWVDMLPLAEIASELQQGLDFLETDMQDMPQRHRSIRATLNCSWEKLVEEDRRVFAKLSVFRGGFTREAAQAIVGANLRQLMRLVNKSFLQYNQSHDRYQVHQLMRQYGAEKLVGNSEQEISVHHSHCTYFCEALQKWEPELKGRQQQVVLQQIKADEDNIKAAWGWAIEQGKWEQVDQAMNGLGRFYMLTVRRQEGARVCQQAAEKLMETISRTPETAISVRRAVAKALAWQANFLLFLGQKEAMNESLQQSLTFLSDLADSDRDSWLVKAHVLFLMGLSAKAYDADFVVAKTFVEQSLAIYQGQRAEWGTAWVLSYLGDLQNKLGFRHEARQSLEKALITFQALGDRMEEYWTLRSFSGITISDGQLEESEWFDQQSLNLATEMGDLYGQVNVLADLAWLAMFRGDLNRAGTLFQKAMDRANDVDYEFYNTILDLRLGQGLVELHQGRYEEARIKFQTASSMSQEYGLGHFQAHIPQFALLQGCLALVEEAYSEAQRFLDKAIGGYWPRHRQHFLVDVLGILGVTLVKLNQQVKAGQQLCQALELALDIRSFRIASPLVGAALLMIELGQNERAVELYALAEKQPMVGPSIWFADVAGKLVETVAATLPPAVVDAVKTRGRSADLWQTAESLFTELQELG